MQENSITVTLFEPWMKDQILALTEQEYPFMKGWFQKRFDALYESEYQHNKNKLVVAVADKKVVACISYIYWPISYREKILHSYQMVGLLVDPALRGKGLFSKVLARLDALLTEIKPEVVIGFPVVASKDGFIKQGWQVCAELYWYIKPVSIMGLINRGEFKGEGFQPGVPALSSADDFLQTAPDEAFWKLREDFFPDWPTWSKQYRAGNKTITIIFRLQKVKGLNVAVIGRIYSGSASVEEITSALRNWMSDLRKQNSIAAVTAAVNEESLSAEHTAIKKFMFRLNKKIIAIAKSYTGNTVVSDSTNWNLMRGDMETW